MAMNSHCGDVLIVDDDRPSRTLLVSLLERAGYTARAVTSAEEALESVAEQRPDVVLTDVQLPGVSGYELCRELRATHGDALALMIVSGERTEPFDRAAGILLGADDYMAKPVDSGELIARVWRLAGRVNGRRSRKSGGDSKIGTLSAREREVLDLLAAGSDQEDIAQQLFISPKTVATHIQRTLTKLGVHSRTQAVALALTQGRDVPSRRLAVSAAE
jgi:DNA-binding NarL/FixJ family response regulator